MRKLHTCFTENKAKNTALAYTHAMQFSYGKIVDKDESVDAAEIKDIYAKYSLVKKGDIIINGLNLNYDFVSQRVAIVPKDGIITSAYIAISPRPGICPEFFCYLFKSMDSRKKFHGMGTGIRLTLSFKEIRNLPIPLPPLPEQKAIVAYLDEKLEGIDKTIASEEKMIALLQERREIIINEAVAPRDGWEVRRLKSILRPHKRLVGKRCNEYDLLSLTLRGIVKRDMENPEGKFPASFETYQEVNPGDFVFCMFDNEETPRAVGLSSLRGMITGAYDVMSLVSDGVSRSFLNYYFLWLDDGKRLKPLYKGLRKTVPLDSFLASKMSLPPLPEQEAIVARLDRETGKIDRAIEMKRRQIALLRERREIIIDEAVTGKAKAEA